FINAFVGWDNIVMAILFGASVGGLIVAFFANRADEYFQTMLNTGMRWVMLVLALGLFAAFLLNIFDVSYSVGFTFASSEEARSEGSPFRYFHDANVLGTGLMVVFYAGYAFAWAKDRWGN
ncbi:MAG: hypothetical protein AAGK01_05015, partial [Pseudomonadota bacterium]